MRKKLKNLKYRNGSSQNGAPRQLLDMVQYRERRSGRHFDSEYAGQSWASRPRDQAVTLRGGAGVSSFTG